mmetsp:Transcript_74261/g.204561  ORF Transcript_74261/g.204561 Transcript_74261/m.204561 type:complete len:232 (-) Transcript_74261:4170-4865(-)
MLFNDDMGSTDCVKHASGNRSRTNARTHAQHSSFSSSDDSMDFSVAFVSMHVASPRSNLKSSSTGRGAMGWSSSASSECATTITLLALARPCRHAPVSTMLEAASKTGAHAFSKSPRDAELQEVAKMWGRYGILLWPRKHWRKLKSRKSAIQPSRRSTRIGSNCMDTSGAVDSPFGCSVTCCCNSAIALRADVRTIVAAASENAGNWILCIPSVMNLVSNATSLRTANGST